MCRQQSEISVPINFVVLFTIFFQGRDKSEEKETLLISVVKPFVYVQPVAFDKGMQDKIDTLRLTVHFKIRFEVCRLLLDTFSLTFTANG